MPASMYSQTTHPTLRCRRQQRRHSHHEQRTQPGTQGHQHARRIVRDNIDTLHHCPDHRVMQKTNRHPIYQRGQQNTDLGRDDGSCARKTSVASTTVLIIAGISTGAVSRGLIHAAAVSSPNGITLNVFDSLAHLPNYSETLENQRLPRPVAALRNAAIEAHAAIVLTHYYGHIPAMVHNAIDWLTRPAKTIAEAAEPVDVPGRQRSALSVVPDHNGRHRQDRAVRRHIGVVATLS